jgi:chromosome segregation ATPase
MSTSFDLKIAERLLRDGAAEQQAHYRNVVDSLARGEEVNAVELHCVVNDMGKTAEQLRDDVEERSAHLADDQDEIRRDELRAALSTVTEAAAAKARKARDADNAYIRALFAELRKTRDRFVADHQAEKTAIAELQQQREALDNQVKAIDGELAALGEKWRYAHNLRGVRGQRERQRRQDKMLGESAEALRAIGGVNGLKYAGSRGI